MMNQQYGYHPHQCHGGPLMYPSRAVFMGSLSANRAMSKMVVVIGVVLLTVSAILLFCGILNFAGVIAGETFSIGIPLLGFGGVILLAGLGFTTVGCMGMKTSTIIQEEVQNSMPAGTVSPPSGAGYPSTGSGYPPHGSGYPPPVSGYPPPGSGYPSPGSGYPPPGSGYPPPGSGYPPPGSSYPISESPPPGYPYPHAQPIPVSSASSVENYVEDSTLYTHIPK